MPERESELIAERESELIAACHKSWREQPGYTVAHLEEDVALVYRGDMPKHSTMVSPFTRPMGNAYEGLPLDTDSGRDWGKFWVACIVVVAVGFLGAIVHAFSTAPARNEKRAVEAVYVACGPDAAKRFQAYLDTDGNQYKPRIEAGMWAARCQGQDPVSPAEDSLLP